MLLMPGLLPVFSAYQLYQQIKDMKIWQQVLAQQMKPLISPSLIILTPQKPLHSQGVLSLLCLLQSRGHNHMCSCKSLAGRLESHQRGFWIETLILCPGDLLSKSSKLTFSQENVVGGQSPVNVRRVGEKHNTVKKADSGFWGQMFRKIQGAPLKPDSPCPSGFSA